MTSRGVSVEFADGSPFLVLRDPVMIEELRAVVARVNSRARYVPNARPLRTGDSFVSAAGAMLALVALAREVPNAEPDRAWAVPSAAQWITTAAAAQHLGISDRAVRKRVATGSLAGTKVGKCWLVKIKEIADEAA